MQVLDWRPRAEKLLTGLWSRDMASPGGAPGPVRNRLEKIHAALMRRYLASRPDPPSGPLIVSVGNLALGGTGKTPVVAALAAELAARGHTGCVLTRGFRSPLAGPCEVTPQTVLAGDEARLLAQLLAATGWRVVQARDRAAGLRHVLSAPDAPAVILLEDAHQTRGVGRHLDIVILDHWAMATGADGPVVEPRTGAVFPCGPYRESAAGAGRAAIWLLESDTAVPPRGAGGGVVTTFRRSMSCRPANGPAQVAARLPRQAALVCGIARPGRFEAGAAPLLADPAVLAVRLADHETYAPRLVAGIVEAMTAAGAQDLVTTAKDWVKLEPFWPVDRPVFVMDLLISWGNAPTLPDLVGERLGG